MIRQQDARAFSDREQFERIRQLAYVIEHSREWDWYGLPAGLRERVRDVAAIAYAGEGRARHAEAMERRAAIEDTARESARCPAMHDFVRSHVVVCGTAREEPLHIARRDDPRGRTLCGKRYKTTRAPESISATNRHYVRAVHCSVCLAPFTQRGILIGSSWERHPGYSGRCNWFELTKDCPA